MHVEVRHLLTTGKTYVGIQIVRALLTFEDANRRIPVNRPPVVRKPGDSVSPILCVCFTNHALDQFLLGLIHAGIDNIVRLGGSSRCEEMGPYNLKNKQKRGTGSRGFELLTKKMPELEKRIQSMDSCLKKSSQRYIISPIVLTPLRFATI